MYVLVPVALVVVLAAVIAYVWAARRGQFDDLTTPAIRALHDEPGEAKIAKRTRSSAAPGGPKGPSGPPPAEEEPR
jgi:cbb3-type cytochrome oxidase maturation protein